MISHFTVEGPAIDTIRLTGARVHYLGHVFRKPRTLRLARRRLNEVCREYKYDVAVFHQSPHLVAALADVLWRRNVKLVRYFHNETYPGSRSNGSYALSTVTSWISQSSTAAFCSRASPMRTERSYTALLMEMLSSPTRSDRKFVNDSPLRLKIRSLYKFAGWRKEKGHSRLLQALATLKSIRWTCWIVGGPQRESEISYFDNVKSLAGELGIADRVRFLGTRNDVPALLAAADIFCHPNSYPPEPFGIAFVEALQAGLPVVTSAMGGAMEIVSEECGFLLPPEDDIALADALQRI